MKVLDDETRLLQPQAADRSTVSCIDDDHVMLLVLVLLLHVVVLDVDVTATFLPYDAFRFGIRCLNTGKENSNDSTRNSHSTVNITTWSLSREIP